MTARRLLPTQPVTIKGDLPSRDLVEIIQRLVGASGGGSVSDGDKGDVIVTVGGTVWTIDGATVAGRAMLTAASATAQTALLNVATSGANGLVPATGGGTTTFLRADLTFAAPAAGGSVTLLGTLTTTSGSSQTLSSLVLTNYSFLRLAFMGVSTGGSTGNITVGGSAVALTSATGNTWRGIVDIDLSDGAFSANLATAGVSFGVAATPFAGDCTITTVSTSVVVATTINNFDAGSVRVYGIA